MKNLHGIGMAALQCFTALVFLVSQSAFAEDHVIGTTAAPSWKSATGESQPGAPGTPLVIEVAVGDTVLFDIKKRPHGVMTLDKPLTEGGVPTSGFVRVCGETQPTPNAVLEEDCPAEGGSNFDKSNVKALKLKVLDNFTGSVNFWCRVHTIDMWGTITLKP